MASSASERHSVRAVDVKVTEDELSVVLEDGRTLVVGTHGSLIAVSANAGAGVSSGAVWVFIGQRSTMTSALKDC